MALPNAIIAGAPKSGSSSLHWWLSAHPEVCGSKVKETHFFDDDIVPKWNGEANVHQHGLDVYERYFAHCDVDAKVVMEATPMYLYQEGAPKNIAALPTDPKIIFILREPSMRAHSQFRFNKHRLGNIDRSKSYQLYLSEKKGTKADPLQRGKYIEYIQRWVEVLGKERILVVQFEQVFNDKVKWMKEISRFLGVDPSFYEHFDFMKRNETRKMRSTKLHKLGLSLQHFVPTTIQEKVIIPLYLRLNSTAMPKTSTVDRQEIETHKAFFTESNARLAESFPNIDLSLWK